MSDEQKCAGCGAPLSEEDGITLVMDDAGLREYYCATCKPPGHGYTISDLQQMRQDGQAERAKYEMSLMDKVGPDVYFAVKGRPDDEL